MHRFARNGHTSSETRDLKVGITQIDPGGSNGSKKSEVRSYGARRGSKFAARAGAGTFALGEPAVRCARASAGQ